MNTPFQFHSVAQLSSTVSVLIVHYPEGFTGEKETDDSIGYLWFAQEDMSSADNSIQYPGDRMFFDTPEQAIIDAARWLDIATPSGMKPIYGLILETLQNAGIEVIDDTPAQVSFDMRDDYMYIDIAGVRICVDAKGQAEIIYTYPE